MNPALHDLHRHADPELSAKGAEECRMVGARLRELGIKIDLMVTSPMKRAIQSLSNVRETYGGDEVSCQVMPSIHENSGIHELGRRLPGLTRS